MADYITVWDETVDESAPLELFDPRATWKRKTYTNFTAKPLQVPVFPGRRAGLSAARPAGDPGLLPCRRWTPCGTTVKRFENPHTYYVDLSQKLFDIKQDLLCRSTMTQTAPPSGGAVCSQNIGCGVLGISV